MLFSFFIAGFLRCSTGDWLQIWLLLRVSSHWGCCSYSEMHMVDQRQRLQTCILKPIHYPHNENVHPTPHGRLGDECEWGMLRLEAMKERTKLPNYPVWCFLVPSEEFCGSPQRPPNEVCMDATKWRAGLGLFPFLQLGTSAFMYSTC